MRSEQESGAGPSLGIVILMGSLEYSGGLKVVLDLLGRWRGLGADASLFIVQQTVRKPVATVDPAVPVYFGADTPGRFRYQFPRALRRLMRLTRRTDVIVSGSEVGNGLLVGYIAARLGRRPFVVFVQSDLDDAVRVWIPRPFKKVSRWIIAHADAAICVADSIVPGVIRNGMAKEAISVVSNGVDVDGLRELAGLPVLEERASQIAARPHTDFTPGAAADSGDSPVVVANGRLTSVKGFDLLLRAHALVRSHGVSHRLRIMGEGTEREDLEQLARDLKITDTVEMPGFVHNPYLDIARADLFVLSSRLEGMPLTVLEALAVGAPVVATECSTAVAELLQGSEYGELVEPGSVEALAGAIEAHLRAPRRLEEKARFGPNRARGYDIDSSARKHLEVLGGVLESARLANKAGHPASGVVGVNGSQRVNL